MGRIQRLKPLAINERHSVAKRGRYAIERHSPPRQPSFSPTAPLTQNLPASTRHRPASCHSIRVKGISRGENPCLRCGLFGENPCLRCGLFGRRDRDATELDGTMITLEQNGTGAPFVVIESPASVTWNGLSINDPLSVEDHGNHTSYQGNV